MDFDEFTFISQWHQEELTWLYITYGTHHTIQDSLIKKGKIYKPSAVTILA